MLVLSRKENEEVVIDRRIRVKLVKLGRGRVSLGISAPPEVDIRRAELLMNDSQGPLEMHELVAGAAATG